ncbi:DeoR/GlpR family DNA-binding transcription regulator [Geminicoccaceae bacterium 1502E]|nr:DeoR/GlpR family DNA-binding transcription regulator [Geminicoccaceae bacterium 1502E]
MRQLSRRQEKILNILAQRGYVTVDELVTAFGVTPQTLRRDLQELAGLGLLRRHHGSASANISTSNVAYGERHVEMEAEKASIGRAAAELVQPGNSLFLTPGTTVDALARAIAARRPSGLKVITNSTVVASILDECPDIAIHVTGGRWMRHNRSMSGAATVAQVGDYRCDLCLTSIGGIAPDGTLLEYRDDDVVVGRAMLANARHTVLLADHTKFSRIATCRLGHLRDVGTFVTDRRPAAPAMRVIRESGCSLIVAR